MRCTYCGHFTHAGPCPEKIDVAEAQRGLPLVRRWGPNTSRIPCPCALGVLL